MKSRRFRFVSAVCAAGVAGSFVGFDASSLQAGTSRDTAFASVTVQAAAQVGLVTVTPVSVPVTGGIPAIPISTTSQVGFGSAGGNDGEGSTGGGGTTGDAATSTGTSTTPEQAARTFAARGASPLSIGPSAAVAVAGAPNQTFNVILPSSTSFANGGNVVSLSGFQHSAGATPALGSNGSGTFSIGAAVQTAPAGTTAAGTTTTADSAAVDEEAGGTAGTGNQNAAGDNAANGQQTVVAAAFTQRSPFVNIVVSYN